MAKVEKDSMGIMNRLMPKVSVMKKKVINFPVHGVTNTKVAKKLSVKGAGRK